MAWVDAVTRPRWLALVAWIAVAITLFSAPGPVAAASIPNPTVTFVTKFVTPTGQVVTRQWVSLIDIPAVLDVTGDGLPDVTATLQLNSLSKFKLSFQRIGHANSPMPLRIEAVVNDPTGTLPRQHIYFGYDATASFAPANWVSTITLGGGGASPKLDLSTQVTGPGGQLTSIGGLFDGNALAPVNPIGGSVRYLPVPATATLGMTLGNALEVRAGASSPVSATAVATLVDGQRTRQMQAVIASLPQAMAVDYSEDTSGTTPTTAVLKRTVTYSASAPISVPGGKPALAVDYTDRTAGSLTLQAVATAVDVPTGITVTETSVSEKVQKGTFDAAGGSVGEIEGGFANGPVSLPPIDHPYLEVTDNATTQSVVGRIDNLQSASIDTSDDLTTDVQLAPGLREPFDATADLLDSQSSRRLSISGQISNLPRHLHVAYSPSAGTISYDANGETIDQAETTISSSNRLFGLVQYIHALIQGLPPAVNVNLKPADGSSGGSFTTSSPVGLIEATLTDGRTGCTAADGMPCWPLPFSRNGVVLHDTNAAFAAWVRLQHVSGASITQTNGQLHASLDTTPLDAQGTRQSVSVYATIAQPTSVAGGPVTDPGPGNHALPPTTIEGHIPALPDHVSIAQDTGSITYDASSQILYVPPTPPTNEQLTLDSRVADSGPPTNIGPGSGDPVPSSSDPVTFTAHNLGGPNLADGKPHNVDVTVKGLPAHFKLLTGDVASGVGVTDASSQFGQIDATLWDTGDEPSLLSSDATNHVDAITRDGRLQVQGRIAGLTREVFSQTADSPSTMKFDTAFGTAPSQLDVEDWSGASDDPSYLSATLEGSDASQSVPSTTTFQFQQPKDGMHVVWDAASDATVLINRLATKSFGAGPNTSTDPALDHTDTGIQLTLPTHADVCVGQAGACDPQSIQSFHDTPLPNTLTLFSKDATGLITIAGNICTPADRNGTDGVDGVVYDSCPGTTHVLSDDFIIHGLAFENLRMEFSKVHGQGGEYDGEDLYKVYLGTDANGLVIGRLEYHPNTSWNNGVPTQATSGDDPVAIVAPDQLTTDPLAPVMEAQTPFEGVSDQGDFSAHNLFQRVASDGTRVQLDCGNLAIEKPNGLGFENGDNVTGHVIPDAWCFGR